MFLWGLICCPFRALFDLIAAPFRACNKPKQRVKKSYGHPIYGRLEEPSASPFSTWGNVPVEPTSLLEAHRTFDSSTRTLEDIQWPQKESERISTTSTEIKKAT